MRKHESIGGYTKIGRFCYICGGTFGANDKVLIKSIGKETIVYHHSHCPNCDNGNDSTAIETI